MNPRLDVNSLTLEGLIEREWLITNGLGGYACSTLPSLNTRKYHGLLVAAMAPPVRRMVLLSRVEETLHCDGWPFPLACNEYPGTVYPEGHRLLRCFAHDPFPRWGYQGDGWTLEKSLRLLPGHNTVVLSYTLLGGGKPVTLDVRPLLALRDIHELTYQWQGRLTVENRGRHSHRVPATGRTPEVFFAHDGVFEPQPFWYFNTIYRREQERGYAGLEDLWTPGLVRYKLSPGQTVSFACSSEPVDLPPPTNASQGKSSRSSRKVALVPPSPAVQADETYAALLRAAGQFVAIIPEKRNGHAGRGGAPKGPPAAVIWQYPWSPPSPRYSLIALPGLFLVPGRLADARSLLVSLASRLDHGLLPSVLPEDGSPRAYKGADVSLWFAYAVHQYLRHGGDAQAVRRTLYPAILQIIDHYRKGTSLGIETDADGLLRAGETGIAPTWMDAVTSEGPVTPRHGRPVELNALWYNALCVAADLATQFGELDRATRLSELAASVKESFNRQFWNDAAGCCFDVIPDDGTPDASIRPNQLLSCSLPFPVLALRRHERVIASVREELLTPHGVRTLSPRHPRYRGRYAGNVTARDAAYHNGSAFPWLLGPLVTAFTRLRGRGAATRSEALEMLRPCLDRLAGDGLGQVCELFDGDAPHRPGGATASAPAVAELLRCYAQDLREDAVIAPDASVRVPTDVVLPHAPPAPTA
jgi:predicted glycogen debranching enzyme